MTVSRKERPRSTLCTISALIATPTTQGSPKLSKVLYISKGWEDCFAEKMSQKHRRDVDDHRCRHLNECLNVHACLATCAHMQSGDAAALV